MIPTDLIKKTESVKYFDICKCYNISPLKFLKMNCIYSQVGWATLRRITQVNSRPVQGFRDACFSAKIPNGKIVFDDEQREPYSSSVKSPHAQVILSTR